MTPTIPTTEDIGLHLYDLCLKLAPIIAFIVVTYTYVKEVTSQAHQLLVVFGFAKPSFLQRVQKEDINNQYSSLVPS